MNEEQRVEADDAMRRALIWMGRYASEIDCGCETEGHVCGKPELLRDTEALKRARAVLQATPQEANQGMREAREVLMGFYTAVRNMTEEQIAEGEIDIAVAYTMKELREVQK